MEGEEGNVIPITEWPVLQDSSPLSDLSFSRDGKDKPLHLSPNPNLKFRTLSLKRGCEVLTTAGCSSRKLKKDEENETSEPLAAVRIAKWWRSTKHKSQDVCVGSNNPNTILHHVSRKLECQAFLKDEKLALENKSKHGSKQKKAEVIAALASIDDWLGLHTSAMARISKAIEINALNPEYLWLREKIHRQLEAVLVQQKRIKECENQKKCFPVPDEVERVSAKILSVKEFKERYVKEKRPVIIDDLVCNMTRENWNLNYIKDKAGSFNVRVKRPVPGSVEWARLEEDNTLTVAEHIDSITHGDTQRYLFDWSLPLYCPQLAEEISLPEYFSDNFLTRTEPGSLYHDSWPSLFIAHAGMISDLHVDAFASSFWMALFEGEKRWTFFDPADVPLLYPSYQHSLDPVFNANIAEPNLDHFPLLALTKPKQCILKPGELLYVPAGSPHFVENLTASVAVSSNYVDASNYFQVCHELSISGLQDPRASQLLEQLQSEQFCKKVGLSVTITGEENISVA